MRIFKTHNHDFYADNVPRDPFGYERAGQRRRTVLIFRLLWNYERGI